MKTVSDFIKIFEDLSREKVDYYISENILISGFSGICSRVKIPHHILLELEPTSQSAYARFVAAINTLQTMKQDMEIQTNSYDNISYDE